MNRFVLIVIMGSIFFGCNRKIYKSHVDHAYTGNFNKSVKYYQGDFILTYDNGERSGRVKGKLALVKDSMFFINLVSPLGNEIGRLFMDEGKILIINRLNRTYLDTTLNYFNIFIHESDVKSLIELAFAAILDREEWSIHEKDKRKDCHNLYLAGKDRNSGMIIHYKDCKEGKKAFHIMHEDFISHVEITNDPRYGYFVPDNVEFEFYKLNTRLIFEIKNKSINEKFEIRKRIPKKYTRVDSLLN